MLANDRCLMLIRNNWTLILLVGHAFDDIGFIAIVDSSILKFRSKVVGYSKRDLLPDVRMEFGTLVSKGFQRFERKLFIKIFPMIKQIL